MENSVAIIGMGARYPGANDIVGFRRMVERGTVHVQPVPATRWDHRFVHSAERRQANKTPATCGAFMEDFDQFAPEFFGITPKRARIMDPQQRLVLEITRQALEDAGYATRPLANRKVGVYVGATSSDHRSLVAAPVNAAVDLAGRIGVAPPLDEATKAAVTAALPPMQAYSMVGQQLNMIAANVSQAFDFSGPAFAIDTACSSALAALHEAVVHLRAGIVDGAVVSGVYVQLDPTMMVCFSRVGALSPTDACRPFQSDADGFVLGEGVGAVVLKRLADAERDGDRIIAVVRGIAMNNDGRGAGPLTPSAAGQSEAIEQAWRDAACDPATVGLLEAHATGTDAGDRIELEALRKVFGGRVRAPVPISSIKASIGHGIASAGIASLIKAALAVESARILPQHVKGELRPELREAQAWLRVPRERETWRGEQRRAGVSAFGFGGTNVHVVLEAAAEPRTGGAEKAEWRFEFSASAAELLDEYLRQVAAAVEEQALPLRDVAYTLATRRRDRVRTSFVAETPTQFAAGIAAARAAVAAGSPLPETTAGQAGAGQRVTLPPSPLPQRRFWLIDPGKRAAAALTPSRDSDAKESTSDAPAPHAAGVDGLGLVVAAVVAVTAWSPDEVKPDRRFVADLGFDSLTTLELMTVLGRSLPGMTPPPRTLFTPALTVGGLAEYLQQSAVAQTGRVPGHVHVFEISRHPWLHEHRPAGRPLLPMSGLVEAALTALAARLGHAVGLAEFKVLAPVEIAGDRIALQVEITEDFTFTVRAEHGGAVLATGAAAETAGPVPALMVGDTVPGPLPLATFYGEFGFHGPALRGLRAPPRLGATSATGLIAAHADLALTLDGALQLALYWLAGTRQLTAVATGFRELRLHAPWPADGELECVAALADEADNVLRGDVDFRDARGALIAQWRGIEARVLTDASRKPGTTGAEGWPEVRALAALKAGLANAGFSMPYFHAHEGIAAATTRIGGREFINFSSYNYLGFAGDPTVRHAAAAALERYGTSASASRVASGERPLHGDLEREIAAFLGCEDALTLVSGHTTNVAVIGHLFGPEDLVVHDSLAHDCILTGARLSGARRLAFPHNDVGALEELLARERPKARRALIAVEGVYSMDGDLAPLPELVALKQKYDALLLLDEAHSFGVLGATGRGAGEHFGVGAAGVDLWMGTLSKTLASCGGYLAGSATLIDYLRFTLPGFLYSVGLPPANAAAALAALRLLAKRPELPRRLQARSELFRSLCRAHGVDIGASAHSAVVPCLTGSSEGALRLAQALGARGINVQPIFYPAVEEGRARLRFFLSSEHTEEQLRSTAEALAEELAPRRERRAAQA